MKRRFLLISIIIIELLITFNCISRVISIIQAQSRISEFKTQRDILAKEYGAKKEQYEFVRTDTCIEKIAREKLGYAREGDVVYIVPSDKRIAVDLPSVSLGEPERTGIAVGEVGNWWKLFFE